MESANEPSHSTTARSILRTLDVSLVLAGLWYLGRLTFHDAFFSALGVPADLDLTPPISVVSLTVGIAALLLMVNQIGIYFSEWTRSPSAVTRAGYDTLVFVTVGSFAQMFIEQYVGHAVPIVRYVNYAWIALVVYANWIRPVIAERGTRGYLKKLAAYHDPGETSAHDDRRFFDWKRLNTMLVGRMLEWAGPATRLAVIGAVVVCFAAHYFGHRSATGKREWVGVEHPNLPPTERHWVLLSRTDTMLWVTELGEDGAIGPEVRSAALEAGNCRFRPFRIKEAAHQYATPAPASAPIPPALVAPNRGPPAPKVTGSPAQSEPPAGADKHPGAPVSDAN